MRVSPRGRHEIVVTNLLADPARVAGKTNSSLVRFEGTGVFGPKKMERAWKLGSFRDLGLRHP
jgi:hypothetical protein